MVAPSAAVGPDSAGRLPAGAHRPDRHLADTVIYEIHVKGFTRLHPDIPPEIRGTYAGLAHPAAIDHLQRLGVTAVELLPVQHSVPEGFLVDRGLTNYWGYNTIGFLAPHAEYSAAVRAGEPGGQVAEFKDMVAGAARGRHRGDSRRRLQPHPRRPDRWVRRCPSAGWTTRRTTGWTRTTGPTTSTPRAAVTR